MSVDAAGDQETRRGLSASMVIVDEIDAEQLEADRAACAAARDRIRRELDTGII